MSDEALRKLILALVGEKPGEYTPGALGTEIMHMHPEYTWHQAYAEIRELLKEGILNKPDSFMLAVKEPEETE